MRYTATLSGANISRSFETDVGDDLETAKKNAIEYLGDGFIGDRISIYDSEDHGDSPGFVTPVVSIIIGQEDNGWS